MAKREGDLPAALLKAVDDAVREGGASALSLRDVARRAGVSHAAPAHHFGSKAGLLTAFAVQGYRRLAQSVIQELGRASPTDGPNTLAAVGRGYVRFAVSEPAQFEVMFRLDALDEDAPELVQATDAAYSLLSATIERCRLEGSLGDLDPMLVGVSAWSIVHGLASLWISGWLAGRVDSTNIDQLAADVSDLFVDSVLRRQPRVIDSHRPCTP
ncbi:MAG: TetR/AcrR family transcriptional regulator [Acidimicrobiales bacterium]